MNPENYAQLKTLFAEACDIAAPQRLAWIAEHVQDAGLRTQLAQLLEFDSQGSALDVAPTEPASTELPQPEEVAGYRIIRCIGRGAMGLVYEAEERHPRRRLALKVMRPGYAGRRGVTRFEREAHMLARLEHPGIARIYRAGLAALPWGRVPFLAMELVEGTSLARYIDRCQPDRAACIDLWLQICEALEHAHARRVLHRDLKPANVLVTAEGQIKVVDFGVGQFLGGDEADPTLTLEGELVGTLAYMSPEQLEGVVELEAAADVYALGVVGYELLTSRRPFDMGTGSFAEITKAVLEAEPLAAGRADASLRGDLETILAACLYKDPARRYVSAAALAEDLRRHLRHEPIHARPAGAMLRAKKFAARNPWLAAGSVTTLLALVLGLCGTLWMAREASRERDAAVATMDFLRNDVLAAAQPSLEPGRGVDASLRDALLVARATLVTRGAAGGSLETLYAVRAGLHHTLGEVFLSLGDFDIAAEELFRAALVVTNHGLASDLLGSIEAARVQIDIERGDYAAAVARANRGLQSLNPDTMEATVLLAARGRGLINLDQLDLAIADLRRAHSELVVKLGPSDTLTLTIFGNLCAALSDSGQRVEAQRGYERLLEARRETLGPKHPDTISTLSALGVLAMNAGRAADALTRFEEVLVLHIDLYGEEHYLVQQTRLKVVDAASRMQRFNRAEDELEHALAHLRVRFGDGHLLVLRAERHAAKLAIKQRAFRRGIEIYERILPELESQLGSDHADVLQVHSELAWARVQIGELQAGIDGLMTVYERYAEELPDDHPELSTVRYKLGTAYARAEQWQRAVPMLRASWQSDQAIFGEHHPYPHLSLLMLAESLLGIGENAEAEAHLQTLLEHADPRDPTEAQTIAKARALLGN